MTQRSRESKCVIKTTCGLVTMTFTLIVFKDTYALSIGEKRDE